MTTLTESRFMDRVAAAMEAERLQAQFDVERLCKAPVRHVMTLCKMGANDYRLIVHTITTEAL